MNETEKLCLVRDFLLMAIQSPQMQEALKAWMIDHPDETAGLIKKYEAL